MIKVFLVEDEIIVREGMKKAVEWEKHGYNLCGDASDGEMALPLIRKLKPDILITDIKMPFMDGLELAEKVKKELPATEIIILTGYDDFSYAQSAISIGVSEYMLKPVSGDDMIRAVDKLAAKVREKKKLLELSERYENDMQEELSYAKSTFFKRLTSGELTTGEVIAEAEELGIDMVAPVYCVGLVDYVAFRHMPEEYSNVLIDMERGIHALESEGVIVFDMERGIDAIIFKADTVDNIYKIIRDTFSEIEGILKSDSEVKYYMCSGTVVERISAIRNSYAAAFKIFVNRYFSSKSVAVTDYDEESGGGAERLREVDLNMVNQEKILTFLKQGSREETEYMINEYTGFGGIDSYIFRQYVALNIYFCVSMFLEEIGVSKEQIKSIVDEDELLHKGKEETRGKLIELLNAALEVRDNTAGNKYGDMVAGVKDYVEKNYADSDMSLNKVAAHMNFSPNHLSMVFSKQTGQPFVKYLTEYRINKAKELLRCTSKKNNEIASEVGYQDSHYFSYIFKKITGMTPTQYREGKSE